MVKEGMFLHFDVFERVSIYSAWLRNGQAYNCSSIIQMD